MLDGRLFERAFVTACFECLQWIQPVSGVRMLVICNGAIKSGSTWLYNILTQLVSFSPPPEEYLTLNNPRHPCIRPDRLADFLSTEDFVTHDYLSKNHLDKPQHRTLLSRPNVYVFDIERDPKDVIVSHYFHESFRNGYEGSFEDFYWNVGRFDVAKLSRYHALWRDSGPQVYISSYEKLHTDFAVEVRRIAGVLGVSLTDPQIDAMRERTSIKSLRKNYESEPRFEGEKFFRKGTIGDWKNHFDDAMLADIRRVEERGIGPIDLTYLRYRVTSLWQRRGRNRDSSRGPRNGPTGSTPPPA